MTSQSSHEHQEHDDDNTLQWQSVVKIGILASLALYFASNIITGNLANYINARFVWLSYLATALFFILAAGAFYSWLEDSDHDHSHHDHDHDHDHNHSSWWILGVAVFPLILGFLIPSQPLGAESVEGNIRVSAATINTTDVLVDPLERNILDWLRTFHYSDDLSSFDGQEADVVGFVYYELKFPKNYFMLVRFTVSCCVADSSAIGLPIFIGDIDVEDINEGVWVRVRGNFQLGEFDGQTMPILNLSEIEIIEQPANPYINP